MMKFQFFYNANNNDDSIDDILEMLIADNENKKCILSLQFNDYYVDIGDSDDINDENNENKDEIADKFR